MRIDRLELRKYGPFTGTTLDLTRGSEGLHLIHGPNEAGKSSTLRALGAFLFGIPPRSEDSFQHPYEALRIGATLRRRSGETLTVFRRKANKDSLRDADDVGVVPAGRLAEFWGGVGRELFDTMFAIGHAALRDGGRAITEGSGELGEVLFAAGAGIRHLRDAARELEGRMEEIFKPRGETPRLNKLLIELQRLRQVIREARLPPETWTALHADWEANAARLRDLDAECKTVRRQLARGERQTSALPLLSGRKDLLRQLDSIAHPAPLPADFTTRREEAATQFLLARVQEEEAALERDRLEQQLKELWVPAGLDADDSSARELAEQLGSQRKAQMDVGGLIAERDQLQREARALLAELRPDLDLSTADELKLTKWDRVEIQNLAERHEAIRASEQTAREEIAKLKRQLERLARERESLRMVAAPRDLATARRLLADGDVATQFEKARAELAQGEQNLELELARLPGWRGTAADLERLPVPSPAAIEEFESDVNTVRADLRRLEEQRQEAARALAECERRLETLKAAGNVPSERELNEARARREEGWLYLRRAWRDGESNPAGLVEFLASFPAGADLEAAYLATVQAADLVSDRLRREAGRVAELVALVVEHQTIQNRVRELNEWLEATQARQADWDARWTRLWQAIGVTPGSPREMTAWLQRHAAVVALAAQAREKGRLVQDFGARLRRQRAELGQCLQLLTGQVQADSEDATTLRERLQGALEQFEGNRRTLQRLEEETREAETNLSQAEEKARDASAALGEWRLAWAVAVGRLGLPETATPAQANEAIQQIASLFSTLSQLAGLRGRVEAITTEFAQFSKQVTELAGRWAPDLVDQPPLAAASELVERMRQGMTALAARDRAEEKRRAAHGNLQAALARLQALCQEAGCDAPEELPVRERESAQAAGLRAAIAIREEQLVSLAAGASLAEFEAELAAVDADQLPIELVRLRARAEALEAERTELTKSVAVARAELDRMDGGARAAEAAQEVSQVLAAIASSAREYARLRIASELLARAVESYRKRNQGPVLTRASELFRELTNGSFAGLRADIDDKGHPVLVALRPAPESSLFPAEGAVVVPTRGLSDGSADQLYLALRLASLEHHFASAEPIPFVVDDILVHFDDERAARTLVALARFAKVTQVVLFTHHAHIVELARRHLAPDEWFLHELPGPTGTVGQSGSTETVVQPEARSRAVVSRPARTRKRSPE